MAFGLRKALAIVCALLLAPVPLAAQTVAPPVDLPRVKAAAEAGDVAAQTMLGDLYRNGRAVPQNLVRAADWYAKAAEQGDGGAANALASLFAEGLGVAPDPARALALFTVAAQSGAPKHLHDLALAYEQGLGTEPDPARAAELYAQAAELGFPESMVALGVMVQSGTGVEQDIAKAIELYTGPAEAGHVRAQNNLGLIYARGEGVEQDYAQAAKWLSLAASQGLPAALRNLAVLYQNGFGLEANETEAAQLNRLAAEISGGSAGGVALVFDTRLAPADPQRARSYLASARAGDPLAQFLLGYVLADAAQSAADYRVAVDWLEQAAKAGMTAAMANLGILTFEGKGALQDYIEGYTLLTLAASTGHPGALAARDRLVARMTPDQINAANVAAEARWAAQQVGAQ